MNKKVSKLVIWLLLVSLFMSGCKGNKKGVKEPELLNPVNVSAKSEVATYREISNIRTIKASVVPYPEDLSFERDGSFERFHVVLGDNVKKGQVLASQSVTKYETELKQLEDKYIDIQLAYENEKQLNYAEMDVIRTNIEKEKAMLNKKNSDRQKEILSKIDKLMLSLENKEKISKSKYSAYQIQLSDLNAKMATIKKNIKNTNIVAPFDGVISYLANVENGSQTNCDTPLIQIVDTSKKYITCMFEKMNLINKASKIYVTIHGENFELEPCDRLNNGQQISSLQSIMSNCNFILKNSSDKVEFGDTGLVCLLSDYKEKALAVSFKAVYPEGLERNYVYRLNNGQKEKVYVEVGVKTDLYTEIVSGLKEGDVVSIEY